MKPIRILHIVTYMGRGGLETMLMNYYRFINKSNVQFDFLVHRDFKADYDEEIMKLGGRIFHMPRLVPWSKKYKHQLEMFFRNHPEYKIVHVHQDCLSSVSLKIAKKCGIPIRIAHSHSSRADKNYKYFIKLFYMRKIPIYATDLFACGEEAGNWMFRGKSYSILHNAINIKDFFSTNISNECDIIRKELGIGDELVIGHVGRFMPPKNHKFLIDIFFEVVRLEPSAKLILVGDGNGKADIIKKVNNLGLNDNVIFTGVRKDVNQLLKAMDIFVFPSLYEGLPVTIIEAQATGLNCIISDKVPQECIITTGLVSIMKLDDSPEKWANQILKKKNKIKHDHSEEIKKHGYDIGENVKWLENYYINKDKEIR